MSDSNVVFKLFAEKLGGTHVTQFEGRFGEIFYDPALRDLRISDGVTPGGQPLFGNLVETNYDGGSSSSMFGFGDLLLDGGSSSTTFNSTLDGGIA